RPRSAWTNAARRGSPPDWFAVQPHGTIHPAVSPLTTISTRRESAGFGDCRRCHATAPAAQTPTATTTAMIGTDRRQESESQRTSVDQRVGQDVDVHLQAVGDLVAAAAAAAGGVGGIVQPVLRIDDADPAVDRDAFERVRRA